MNTTATVASATLEIRVPRAHVRALADRPRLAARWLWAPAQVGEASSERDLPDGAFQRVSEAGDKLRDRVLTVEDDAVVLESEWLPKEKGVPGRRTQVRLVLENRAGTTRATLSVSLPDRGPVAEVAEQRRWRRHAEQCLGRLAALAEAEGVHEGPRGGDDGVGSEG